MDIRADEISKILKKQISDYQSRVTVAETGTILSIGDGIARIYGLCSHCLTVRLLLHSTRSGFWLLIDLSRPGINSVSV